ncbi:MAG: Sec-independent protein translocase protein TatA [Thermoanaerobacterales bacterium 50_218]|jgi:sec-independent protein translocase protein TatA|nr:MAG: Sec-independent protein translocase protein TatA [Thermoanaerobacterales bacterium 50_218]HAA89602.1 twin-arginine translocase TatA/TatE family subunit [Peptococcaceae bacterium]
MFGLLPNIGPWEIAALLAVVLIIFGPGKLPEAVKSLGKAVKNFRKEVAEPGPKENEKEEKPS